MPKAVKRRTYESPRRRDQARATRRSILGAARHLFIRGGYVATTIDSIAVRAEVSPETVYATFGNKRSILSELLDVSMAGDDAPVPILQRDWVQQLREEPDLSRRFTLLAKHGRLILERTSPIYEVLHGAAASDPQIATLLELNKAQRLAGQRELVRLVVGNQALRDGISIKTGADIVFAIGSPETYRLLVIDRGWSPDRFERWYADSLDRLLLP